jgi:FkbM family methyltransferase
LIQVGAGNGAALVGERFDRIPRLLAIEADDLAFSYMANNFQSRPGWTALKALISDEESESIFYVASNPNESGLLDTEALKAVWRNLGCLETRAQAATTLSTVMQHEKHAEAYNWLCVDCLPATRVLLGLEKQLEQFDVVDLRVLDRSACVLDQGCTQAETDALLEPLGYHAAFVEEGTNPNVLRVLYVRDGNRRLEIETDRLRQQYGFEIEQLSQDNEELKRGKEQLEKDKADLAAARNEQVDRAQQLAQEVMQLIQGKTVAEKLAAERAQQADQAIKAKDEQAKLAQERLAQIEQLTQAKTVSEKLAAERAQQADQAIKAKDEQAKLAQERLAQIEQLTQAKTVSEKLAAERAQQAEQAIKAKDEQAKFAQEIQVQLDQLAVDRDQQAKIAAERQALLEAQLQARDCQRQRFLELKQGFSRTLAALTEALDEVDQALHVLTLGAESAAVLGRVRYLSDTTRDLLDSASLALLLEDCSTEVAPQLAGLVGEVTGRPIIGEALKSPGSVLPIYHRPDSKGDLGVIKQIFIDNQYDFSWISQGKRLTKLFDETITSGRTPLIVDAGANIGASCQWFLRKFPKSRVLAVEPDLENCQLLRYNCAGSPVDLFCGAVADRKRTLRFQDPGESDWGFRVADDGGREVLCIGPDEILSYADRLDYSPIIFKIDIEGGEDLLFSGGCEWLARIPVIIIELHDWLFPDRRTSRNFQLALNKYDFQLYCRGENLFCFNSAIFLDKKT